jgi:hypothetical protein
MIRISDAAGDGLILTNSSDVVTVAGDAVFTTASNNTTATSQGNFSAGEIRLSGNLTQTHEANGSAYAFVPTGTKVVLEGSGSQSVAFYDNAGADTSRLRDVDIDGAAGVTFTRATYVSGRLDVLDSGSLSAADVYYTTTLPRLSSGSYNVTNTRVAGTVVLGEDETLPATTKLHVPVGTYLRLNGHELDVGGDLEVSISDTAGDGLEMTNASDVLTVRGNATFIVTSGQASATSSGSFSAGEIHFKGNFAQSNHSGGSGKSFVATGTRCYFDGTSAQQIHLYSPGPALSHFHDLELDNASPITLTSTINADGDVTITSGTSVSASSGLDLDSNLIVTGGSLSVSHASDVAGEITLSSGGSLTLGWPSSLGGEVSLSGASSLAFGTCTFSDQLNVSSGSSVNGTEGYFTTRLPVVDNATSTYLVTRTRTDGTVTLPWDVTLPSTTMLRVEPGTQLALGGNRLELGGDLKIWISDAAGDGLRLVDAGDVLVVEGGATFTTAANESNATSEGNLSAGEIHFKGGFVQTYEGGGSGLSFVSTGTKAVFNGSTAQSATFAYGGSSRSRFDDLEVQNAAGLSFSSTTYAAGDLELPGKLTVQSGTFNLAGTMTIRSTGVLQNNSTMTVGGCVKEPGHTINGTDPCP